MAESGSFVERGHLGGYREGGDDATWYPALWQWLLEAWNVESVIDVGCGEGHAVDWFAKQGAIVVGIEGVEQHHPLIVQHDFTLGPWEGPCEVARFDLCWSCEFVEHVEERYVDNFLKTFALADLVLMTHAIPGQGGYHHVNLQPAEYWIRHLDRYGYQYDPAMTSEAREVARANENPWNHFARGGLAFYRRR